jgi:hypothetical protein
LTTKTAYNEEDVLMSTAFRYPHFVKYAGVLVFTASFMVGASAQTKTLTTTELAQRAEVVAVGKVTGLESEWNEARTMIRTRVTVAVDEYVKGSEPGSTITIYVPGGEIGMVGEIYSHTAKFRTKENVVVFAEKDSQNRYRISGGTEGKLSVKADEKTGKRMVTGTMSLDQLTSKVRAAIQEQRGY